jgi:hypothetical protein
MHLSTNFTVPPGSGSATLAVPTLNISRVTITVTTAGGTAAATIFVGGKPTAAAAAHGLSAPRFVTAGSSTALKWATAGSGRWAFDIRGDAPTAATVSSAAAKVGENLTVQCPAGMNDYISIAS